MPIAAITARQHPGRKLTGRAFTNETRVAESILPPWFLPRSSTHIRRILIFMVRMTVLASGSRGNSTVVSSTRTRILVDAGVSCRELFKRMQAAGEDPRTLDAILITHEHQDHVHGLAVTARKLGVPVYFTEATHRAWIRWMTPQKRMTYADWLEQRRQAPVAAETAPELDASDSDADEPEALVPEKTESDPCQLPGVEYFQAGCEFSVGDIAVTAFTIPHD